MSGMHDKLLNFDLNDPEVCYILGYFWADCGYGGSSEGPITFSFEIKTQDFEKVRSIIFKVGFSKIKNRYRKNSPNQLSNVRAYRSKDMEFFENFGFGNRDDDCLLYYALAPHLRKFFIKGFLDGDGSVSLDKNGLFRVTFTGSFDKNWGFLKHFCENLGIRIKIYKKSRKAHHKSHTKEHHYSVVEIASLQERVNFLSSLPEVGLERKMDIFKSFSKERLASQESSKFMKKITFPNSIHSISPFEFVIQPPNDSPTL